MSIISLIIKREFISKVRNKSFVVMTFLSPLLFVAITVFISYLSSMKSDTKRIAIHDPSGIFVKELIVQNKKEAEYKYVDLSPIEVQYLKDSITNQSYEGLLLIPNTTDPTALENKIQLIANTSPSISFIENIQDVIGKKITQLNLEKAHIDTLAIKKAESHVVLNLAKTSGEETIQGLNEIKIFIGGAFGYLIMMFIIMYGNMVMRSVIEEKTNRIIEIIISSVKPFQLMIGKIIGTSLAGILQFLIWAILGLSIMTFASYFLGVNVGPTARLTPEIMTVEQTQMMSTVQMYIKELWNLPIASILLGFIVYFIGGYFLYSSFYAAIGAAVDNQTDSQQFLLPIIMPLMLSVYIGFFSVVHDPHGTIAVVFSMIPLTSPIVMLMRIPFGVPLWQIIISVTILFGTFFGVVWFAAKIYRVGILMYGKKPSWKELYRWLKYAG
ncbi:ABC transporter permease [Flavobacterium sp. 7A]|uniref:ABC transporter permease n=1 Tax=Flavobacterium sp. 7A TaxID=2940571 RepID=UPI002227BBE1|nr:ABC transporter permease [Flavobacterium sp. 7A]MCW2121068.1 ABC-2 type transport system permease protein [Flavobacterium sp. 7A]